MDKNERTQHKEMTLWSVFTVPLVTIVRNAVLVANAFLFRWHLGDNLVLLLQKNVKLGYGVWINLQGRLFGAFLPAPLVGRFLLFGQSIQRVYLSIAISVVVSKLALIHFLVLPSIHAKAFFIVHSVRAKVSFIAVFPNAVAMPGSVAEIAFVKAAVCPVILSIPLRYAIDVLAGVVIIVLELFYPESVSQSI
jgi:hypothetical protein